MHSACFFVPPATRNIKVEVTANETPIIVRATEGDRALPFLVHIDTEADNNGYAFPWVNGGGINIARLDESHVVIGKYINNAGTEIANDNNFYLDTFIPVKSSTQYTVTISPAISYFSFMEYGSNKDFIVRKLEGTATARLTTFTITTSANTAYIRWGSNPSISAVTMEKVLSYNWMIAEGSEAQQFTPYENIGEITKWTSAEATVNEDIYPIEWQPDIEYIYGAVVDVSNGDMAVLYSELKSSSQWTMREAGKFQHVVSAYNNGNQTSTNVADLVSTHYRTVSNAEAYNGTDFTCGLSTIAGTTYLYVNDSRFETLQDFTSYIGDVTFVFKSATPMSNPLEPQVVELQDGNNTISATAYSNLIDNRVGTAIVGVSTVG